MPRKLLLFPFGGNAREALLSILALNEKGDDWEIMGFLDDDQSLHGKECCGIKVVGGRDILKEVSDTLLLAIPGSPQTFQSRKELIDSLHVEISQFATILHPSVARAPDSHIGYNTIIMPNVVISCGVAIGNHCIVLPNTVVSHDSVVEDHCCLGSNISISGSVTIGAGCYIGSGTKIRENVSIGTGTLVGLGSVVVSDLPAGVIAVGTPAKVVKKILL